MVESGGLAQAGAGRKAAEGIAISFAAVIDPVVANSYQANLRMGPPEKRGRVGGRHRQRVLIANDHWLRGQREPIGGNHDLASSLLEGKVAGPERPGQSNRLTRLRAGQHG